MTPKAKKWVRRRAVAFAASIGIRKGQVVLDFGCRNGHYSLAVRGLQRPLKVSRAFGHLFRPM